MSMIGERPLTYVLITAARNEEAFLEETIRSVVQQSVRPVRWVIVSDGSIDGTDEIVRTFAADNPWIELVRMPERRDRHFSGKAHCVNAGYARVRDLAYDVIGNVDADVSFEPDYLEFLLGRFAENPRLGVAGTPYVGIRYDSLLDTFAGEEHVPGAVQLFRRRCFEEIGGYLPSRLGGIDFIAVTMARMRGWETRSFTEKHFRHYRRTNTAESGAFMAAVKTGMKDYIVGGHPVWQLFRVVYRMGKRPYVVGGCGLMWGYFWAGATRVARPVSGEFLRFHRREQMRKLRRVVGGRIGIRYRGR